MSVNLVTNLLNFYRFQSGGWSEGLSDLTNLLHLERNICSQGHCVCLVVLVLVLVVESVGLLLEISCKYSTVNV